MTPRERLQFAYELAFLPRRLNGAWHRWRDNPESATPDELKALDEASMLHLALPEGGRIPADAVYRLALYQAGAARYGMRTFIGNVRKRMGRPEIRDAEVPWRMIRDIALPGYHMPAGGSAGR